MISSRILYLTAVEVAYIPKRSFSPLEGLTMGEVEVTYIPKRSFFPLEGLPMGVTSTGDLQNRVSSHSCVKGIQNTKFIFLWPAPSFITSGLDTGSFWVENGSMKLCKDLWSRSIHNYESKAFFITAWNFCFSIYFNPVLHTFLVSLASQDLRHSLWLLTLKKTCHPEIPKESNSA